MMAHRVQRTEEKPMGLEELEKKAKAQMDDIKLRFCDVNDIETYVEALKTRYETEWARTKYLEGYSEALFTKIITLETK